MSEHCVMTLSIELTADLEAELRESLGEDLNRAALESLVAEGYRLKKLGIGQVCRLLGFTSRLDAEDWLAQRGIHWNYDPADLEADRATFEKLFPKTA
jgi:hypothetical protein